jgi:AcrR family transcriptional regulator
MTTKERIIDEALTLFSQRGYKGTSVKNIADAVGIKDSSLYKHFKSKQEILDTIMTTMNAHINEMSLDVGIPIGNDYKEAVSFYTSFSEEELSAFSRKMFLFYLEDPLLSKFWKMGVMEQYQNDQVYNLFHKFFMEDSIQYQTALFAEMSRAKIFIDAEPEVMAMSFFTPIFFLLSKYSGTEGKEDEALKVLDRQVREFYRIYKR